MVYPCGWWQRVSRVYTARICRCAYLDMLGYLLHGGARIFSKHNFLMAHATALQIDYIQGLQIQVSGRGETVYSNEHHGRLDISDIIRVTAFQKMVPLVGYFLRHTLPKLQAARVNSLILKSLPLLAIRRLSWSNTAFRASLVGVSSPTDATLASYMYRGAHNQQRPRHEKTDTEVDTRKRTRHISRMKERREYTEMLLLEATVLASEADRPRTPDPDDPALSSKRCWERAKIEWSVEINNVIAAARERDLEINTQGPHV